MIRTTFNGDRVLIEGADKEVMLFLKELEKENAVFVLRHERPCRMNGLVRTIEAILREREPVGVAGLHEDISGHGYYDPVHEALIRAERVRDGGG